MNIIINGMQTSLVRFIPEQTYNVELQFNNLKMKYNISQLITENKHQITEIYRRLHEHKNI